MNPTSDVDRALERAILETLLYSDLFDYPLTPAEAAYYLSGLTATADDVCACVARSPRLAEQIIVLDGLFALRGREALIAQRRDRAAASDRLWRRARRFVRILRLMPFVRMIAITGALAMENCTADDDIDVMIVTAPDRVWLTRACAILLVYAGRLGGDTLCPNYVISERALTLNKHTLFVAHEFTQMIPVYGFEVYQRLRAANPWLQSLLPNATQPWRREPDRPLSLIGRGLKRGLERLLSGRIGDAVEAWEMRRKLRKFQSQLGRPDGDALLDRDHVKGHFDDYGEPVMRLYTERVAQLEL